MAECRCAVAGSLAVVMQPIEAHETASMGFSLSAGVYPAVRKAFGVKPGLIPISRGVSAALHGPLVADAC